MGVAKIGVPVFAVLTAAILTLSVFPPVTTKHLPVSSGISPAQRAVIFGTILSGYATINEGADHIVAVSKPAREWGTAGLMRHVYPALTRIPVAGVTIVPDPEQILYLRPDAVLAFPGQIDALRKTGLPRLIEVKFDTRNQIRFRAAIWKTMGEVAGKSTRARMLSDRYIAKRADLQRQLPPDAAHKERVAYVHVDNGRWFTANSSHFLAYKLELAGAINVAQALKYGSEADLEELLLLDPDVILFFSDVGDDRTTMRETAGRPEFQALRAIRERRIYKLPEHTYMNEPVEDPLLLTWMAEVFYPDIMPRGLRKEYRQAYQEVYHYAISDDEIDRAIYLEENSLSVGYDRFVR